MALPAFLLERDINQLNSPKPYRKSPVCCLLFFAAMLPPGNTVFNQYRASGEEEQCFLINEKIVFQTVTHAALLSLHQIDVVISRTQNILLDQMENHNLQTWV